MKKLKITNMFNKKSPIKERVMQVINTKIADAEQKHCDGCKAIDDKAESDKLVLADTIVNELLGKVL